MKKDIHKNNITHLLLFPFRITRFLFMRLEEVLSRFELQVNLYGIDEC